MFSGAWCTTNANTLLTILMAYVSLRSMGISEKAALHHLGAAFGDDTASQELINQRTGRRLSEELTATAASWGLKLEIIPRPSTCFSFLSRYYEVTYNGNTASIVGSMVDLARQLPKFQGLAKRDAKLQDWRDKFSCLLLLVGKDCPIISAYVSKWMQFYRMSPQTPVIGLETPYWLTICDGIDDAVFPPVTEGVREYVLEQASHSLRIDVESIGRADSLIKECRSLLELERIYISREPPAANANYHTIGDLLTETTTSKMPCEPTANTAAGPEAVAQAGRDARKRSERKPANGGGRGARDARGRPPARQQPAGE